MMGSIDAFYKEDRISMKYSDVYRLLKFEKSANNTSPNIEPINE